MSFNYSNGLIYKIVCNDTNIKDCYIGSTTNFVQRKSQHKSACNNENGKKYNIRVYKCIRENGGWDNWSMLEVEKYSCNTKRELELRERHCLDQLKANLNCFIPSRTLKEYREENRDKILEHQKEYYEENKDKILERMKEYDKKNKDKKKEYCENNKDKIKERNSKIFECQCGSIIKIYEKPRHKRTKKHKFYEEVYNFIHS